MLSRVAERTYWLGRYLERAENTARLLGVSTHLLLDLPRNVRLGWRTLVEITGADALFDERFHNADERNVVRFMLGDTGNPGSVLSALHLARENARTTREILPNEAWERINDLYLLLQERSATGVRRAERQPLLQRIIAGCQGFTGLLEGCLSHADAYTFICLGRNLERADMTTRILDVRTASLIPDEVTGLRSFDNIQWMSVLKSLTAYQMYRLEMQVRVKRAMVLEFLFRSQRFPRSVRRCLDELERRLEMLPNHEDPLRVVHRMKRTLAEAPVQELSQDSLHAFIDELQIGLGDVHAALDATFFHRAPANAA